MCDPVTAITIGGAVASAAGAIYEGSQASSEIAATNKAQQDANNSWVAYQTRIHQQQTADEEAARSKATGAQQDTLQKISPQAQEDQQTTEAQRLNTLYTKPGSGAAQSGGGVEGMALSGENTGNQNFKDSLTSQVNQATSQARQRIQAQAVASSYGGSFGGLGTTVPITLAKGGNDINLQNAIRQGDLKTYGVEQQVQPINYTVGPGTEAKMSLAKALGGFAGTLAGIGLPGVTGAISGAAAGAGASAGTGIASAGGLTPQFTNDALASFNSGNWNQWG